MATRLPTASRNAAAAAIAALADAGSGPATLEIRTGAQPASANDAATGTLLATITLDDPAAGSPATGVITLEGLPLEATAIDTGTAGWFRVLDSDSATVMDGSVTVTGGGGELTLASTALATGITVRITTATITMPAST